MRYSSSARLTLSVLVLTVVQFIKADSIEFQSGASQTALLELYTSEGCSSCPPAETWLSRLKESPKLWKDFVPVAFHVDYWDYLGWKDPFAAEVYTERQHEYASLWRSRSVYTPGFVLNGKEWRDWPTATGLSARPQYAVGVLTAHSDDRQRWLFRFRPGEKNAGSNYNFCAALLGFDLVSDVKSGENRGRRLDHDFVVLAFAKCTSRQEGDYFKGDVSLSTQPGFKGKRLAVAAWIGSSKGVVPIQAVGGWLPSPNQTK
jgi:hypothetical protein